MKSLKPGEMRLVILKYNKRIVCSAGSMKRFRYFYMISFVSYRSNGCICSPFAAFDADTGTSAMSATKEFGLPEQSS